jgi:hypothetical protein
MPIDVQALSMVHDWDYGDAETALAEISTTLGDSLGIEPFLMFGKQMAAAFV